MTMTGAYVRYRRMIHMRMILGTFVPHVSESGIKPDAILPYGDPPVNPIYSIGEIFNYVKARNYSTDYYFYRNWMVRE